MDNPRSKIIAIEGIDGSGKNTQVRLLREYLAINGIAHAVFSFPRYSNTFFGEMIKQYLNGEFGSLYEVDPRFSALLYAGNRFETLKEIQEAMQKDNVIIIDRYVGSNLAHQSAKLDKLHRGKFIKWLLTLEYDVYSLPKEDITIYLHMDPDIAQLLVDGKQEREYTQKKRDLHESNIGFLSESAKQFFFLAHNMDNWVIIRCQDPAGKLIPPSSINAQIVKILKDKGIIPNPNDK